MNESNACTSKQSRHTLRLSAEGLRTECTSAQLSAAAVCAGFCTRGAAQDEPRAAFFAAAALPASLLQLLQPVLYLLQQLEVGSELVLGQCGAAAQG